MAWLEQFRCEDCDQLEALPVVHRWLEAHGGLEAVSVVLEGDVRVRESGCAR